MGLKGEEVREEKLETASRYNFFEEFCCKEKRNGGGIYWKGRRIERVCFYDERILIWYWEREWKIDAGQRGRVPIAVSLTE